jgi:hypothetical protein
MLATTKQVRKLVHSICTVGGRTYTDVSASKRYKGAVKTNLRNVTFSIRYNFAQEEAQQLREALFLSGYTNKVKVTVADSGCYLRINNCTLEV